MVIKDIASGKIVGDTIRNVKFSGVSWKGNEGFYYSTYDIPAGANRLVVKTIHHTLYYHKMGEPQKLDKFIFGGDRQPHRYIGGEVTEDQHWLVITGAETTYGNELYIQDLTKKMRLSGRSSRDMTSRKASWTAGATPCTSSPTGMRRASGWSASTQTILRRQIGKTLSRRPRTC